jgi:LTXXQ motif family protein
MTHSMRAAVVAAALLLGSSVTASAQGGPPGGGPGGGRRMEQMASLERPMAGVEGVTDAQKDTLQKIEAAYKVKFTASGTAMREMMMAARQSGGPPDMAAMMKMRDEQKKMHEEELAAVRALLTPAQHPKFDENVKVLQVEDAAREAQMRERMGRPPQ